MAMTSYDMRAWAQPWLGACETYRFNFAPEDTPPEKGDTIVAATGGPGLGWRYAINAALRERARQRGEAGWRSVRCERIIETAMRDSQRRKWVALLTVVTSRGERLNVGVRRGPQSDG